MAQICKFNEMPSTISDGGYKKGRWIVWLNLGVYANVSSIKKDGEDDWVFAAHTDRLVLSNHSVSALLEVIDPLHLAMATTDEVEAILKYFNAHDDVESWKEIRKVQIKGYDKSQKVNCFYLGSKPMWLEFDLREKIRSRLPVENTAGRTTTTLWHGTMSVKLSISLAMEILDCIELYATDCYDVTASHIAEIEELQSVDELRNFKIEADYPEIPHFPVA